MPTHMGQQSMKLRHTELLDCCDRQLRAEEEEEESCAAVAGSCVQMKVARTQAMGHPLLSSASWLC
jgi:hypothetical protein